MALTASDIDTSKTSQHTARLDKIGMALEALRNVIKGNPGLSLCYCYFPSLFLGRYCFHPIAQSCFTD